MCQVHLLAWVLLVVITWSTNYLVHTVFALKYWIVAHKVAAYLNGSEGRIECKAKILFWTQVVIIIGVMGVYGWIESL